MRLLYKDRVADSLIKDDLHNVAAQYKRLELLQLTKNALYLSLQGHSKSSKSLKLHE